MAKHSQLQLGMVGDDVYKKYYRIKHTISAKEGRRITNSEMATLMLDALEERMAKPEKLF